MQDQPPSRSSGTRRKAGPLGGFAGLDPRRRAILLGGAIAVIGLAMLLRPHPHPAGPVAGSDPATLAGLINLAGGAERRAMAPDARQPRCRSPGPVQGELEAGGRPDLRPGRCWPRSRRRRPSSSRPSRPEPCSTSTPAICVSPSPALEPVMSEPLYRRVKRHILEHIGSGELAEGAQVPSENELTRDAGRQSHDGPSGPARAHP